MENVPESADLIVLLRDADERVIRKRLDEIEAESAALRTLLRAVVARQRHAARPTEVPR